MNFLLLVCVVFANRYGPKEQELDSMKIVNVPIPNSPIFVKGTDLMHSEISVRQSLIEEPELIIDLKSINGGVVNLFLRRLDREEENQMTDPVIPNEIIFPPPALTRNGAHNILHPYNMAYLQSVLSDFNEIMEEKNIHYSVFASVNFARFAQLYLGGWNPDINVEELPKDGKVNCHTAMEMFMQYARHRFRKIAFPEDKKNFLPNRLKDRKSQPSARRFTL